MQDTIRLLPTEGVSRCPCGSKYWDGLNCHDCGEEWKPKKCEFWAVYNQTTCTNVAKYYAGGPSANDWACNACQEHLPRGWHIMDRLY